MKNMKRIVPIIIASVAIVTSTTIATFGVLSSTGVLKLTNPDLAYKCKFKNIDGSLLYTCDVKPNTIVQYKGKTPAIPETETFIYSFDGWDQELSFVSEDTTFTATYKAKRKDYRVEYQNYDGTVLYSTYVSAGDDAHYGAEIPEREPEFGYAYVFTGWDKSEKSIYSNTTLIAQYREELLTFNVDFVNYDGEVLYSAKVPYGGTAVYKGTDPTPPVSEEKGYEYVFDKWDKPTGPILEDTDFYAEYELIRKQYVVKFLNYDESLLDTEKVDAGSNAVYNGQTPIKPTDKDGRYVFIGWDLPIDSIYEDTTVHAQYSSLSSICHVKFLNYDEELLEEKDVDFGEKVFYEGETPTRESDDMYDYKFIGWDRDLDEVTENLTAIAQYERYQKTYKVTYKNYDDSILSEQEVKAGEKAVYNGETPTRPTDNHYRYVFKSWNIDPDEILADTELYAIFDAIPLEQGMGHEEGAGGSGSGTGGDGTGSGMGGGGGGGEGEPIDSLCSVIFANYDGSILDADYVVPGRKAYYDGETPVRPDDSGHQNYYFELFDKPTDVVNKAIVTYAQYKVSMSYYDLYVITFRNDNGAILYEDFCEYGEVPNYEPKTDPVSSRNNEKQKFVFVGWDRSLTAVQGCYTLYAHYELASSSIGGSVSTDAPEFGDENPIFTYQTTYNGAIHLRDKSFGDYANNNWSSANEYIVNEGETSPLHYASDLIINSGNFTSSLLTYYKGETLESGLLPMYSSTYLETGGSDIKCKPNLSNQIDYEFYPVDLSEISEPLLKPSNYSSSNISSEEAIYCDYVRDKYLSVSDTHKVFFNKLIEKNNLKADSIEDLVNVRDFIKASAKYNLKFKSYPADKDAVIYFLETAKEGICNHFASALTLLYRTLGVPARFTVGYLLNSDGKGEITKVTSRNAHAWTEIYIDGIGWVCVDGTAPMDESGEGGGGGGQGEGGGGGGQGHGEIIGDPLIDLILVPKASSKVYDGEPMEIDYLAKTLDLEDGETIKINTEGNPVDVGIYETNVNIKVLDKNGNDVTSKYNGKISFEVAQYQILPKEITIITGSDQKVFDGKPLTCDEFEVLGGLPENEKVIFKGASITNIGICLNTPLFDEFMIWNTKTKKQTMSNYIINWQFGTLKVTR